MEYLNNQLRNNICPRELNYNIKMLALILTNYNIIVVIIVMIFTVQNSLKAGVIILYFQI